MNKKCHTCGKLGEGDTCDCGGNMIFLALQPEDTPADEE